MSRFQILLEKYVHDSLSESELQEFLDMFPGNKGILEEKVLEDFKAHTFDGMTSEVQREIIFERILAAKETFDDKTVRTVYLQWRWIAAAVIIFCLAVGSYLLLDKKGVNKPLVSKKTIDKTSINPGGNHALLTLANGATIILDDAANGSLTTQGNTKVVKLDSGRLVYVNNHSSNTNSVIFNTISTPRGGQYQVTLPDGTQVWLNAASSLKFPTSFNGNSRQVELNGEAYFEVAKNKAMPFNVMVRQTEVTVLGTHFNINAYSDEKSINTTLLEGSVEFSTGTVKKLLHPGQQSVFINASQDVFVKHVDVNQVIAWKNGFFEFDNTDLQTIMRQIARWYDVDVSYRTANNRGLFGGGISRRLGLPEVLHLLETNGVQFKTEGRRVTVVDNKN